MFHVAILDTADLTFMEVGSLACGRPRYRFGNGFIYLLNLDNVLQIYRLSFAIDLENPLVQFQLDDNLTSGIFLFDTFLFRRYHQYNYDLVEVIDVIIPNNPEIVGDWPGGEYNMENWYVLNDSLIITDKGEIMDLSEICSPVTIAHIQDEVYSAAMFSDTLLVTTPSSAVAFQLNETSGYETPGETSVPSGFALHAAYPNPFNPVTRIRFEVPETSDIRISVHNILGQEVVELLDREMTAGYHEISFLAENLASGLYFVRCPPRLPGHSEGNADEIMDEFVARGCHPPGRILKPQNTLKTGK